MHRTEPHLIYLSKFKAYAKRFFVSRPQLLCTLSCEKEQNHPFISCKLDGVYWETEYKEPQLLDGESPYDPTYLIPSGLVWECRGSRMDQSQMVLRFRIQEVGGLPDSLAGISYLPAHTGVYYSGGNGTCDGDFTIGKTRHIGTFSGTIMIGPSGQNGRNTIEVTEGKFEIR
jgi:hypothetical protein